MELTTLQKRFYQTEVNFNNFADIDEETIAKIKSQHDQPRNDGGKKLPLYTYELEYLLDLRVRQTRFKTFDERIIALILMIDPNFVMYHTYANTELPTQAQIDSASEEEKSELLERKKEGLNAIIRTIRDSLGLYDSKMLKYEGILYRKFLKPEKIVAEATTDYTFNLMKSAKLVRSFANVTDERYKEIADLVAFWESETNGLGNAKLASNSLLMQNNILKLANVKEQMLFFVMAVDPELKMLSIHEEESKSDEVKRRILEEFGFMDEDMLRIERLYHARFCPDKKVSVWSF